MSRRCQPARDRPDHRHDLVAELGDIGRFPSAGTLCAWPGSPGGAQLRRKVGHGHSTKQGSPWVRWVLQEAAQRAKTHPPFASFSAKTAARRGTHIATVAVARQLLARCFPVLTELQTTAGEGQPPGALAHHLCLHHGPRTA